MDELQMIREAYGEPEPPTLREMTEARAAMTGTPPRTRVRFGRRLKAGIGVVAGGAAATVAIAAIGSGSPAPPSSPAVTDLGERAVLAAAEKAAAQPTGKYWHSDTVDGQSYIIRAKTGTYAITAASTEHFHWTGVKRGMGEAYYSRDLPAHPVSARDEALWRKAGSPPEFRVWSNDHYYVYPAKATEWQSSRPGTGIDPRGGGEFYGLGLGGSSFEDLQNLPTAPAELAERFFSRTAIERPGPGKAEQLKKRAPRISREVLPYMQIQRAMAMLTGPLPPEVRGGLMRALAAQPGVHAVGSTTDPLGRPGVALATADRAVTDTADFGTPKAEQGTYSYRKVIIFDERTGALLSVQEQLTKPGGKYAQMKPGFVINYQLERASGWSDTKPEPPAELPF